jgi:hypothetical protein
LVAVEEVEVLQDMDLGEEVLAVIELVLLQSEHILSQQLFRLVLVQLH